MKMLSLLILCMLPASCREQAGMTSTTQPETPPSVVETTIGKPVEWITSHGLNVRFRVEVQSPPVAFETDKILEIRRGDLPPERYQFDEYHSGYRRVELWESLDGNTIWLIDVDGRSSLFSRGVMYSALTKRTSPIESAPPSGGYQVLTPVARP